MARTPARTTIARGTSAGHQELLGALRSGDERRQREALGGVYAMLERSANRLLGSRRGRADFQVESVVQSVLASSLPAAIAGCQDDAHLERWLRLALKNKIIDRGRKKRPAATLSADGATVASPDGRAMGPGPLSSVIRRDHAARAAGDGMYEDVLVRVLEAARSPRERNLIRLHLAENRAWGAIAEALGMETNAAKVAFTRLRPRLVLAALDPIRRAVDGSAWAVASSLLVERRSTAQAATLVGVSERDVGTIFQKRVLPALERELGGRGLEMLVRLLGRPISVSPRSGGSRGEE